MKKITKSVVLAALSALLLFGCKNSTAWIGAILESEEGNPGDIPGIGNPDDNPSGDDPSEDDPSGDDPVVKGTYINVTSTREGLKITFADNVRVIRDMPISVDSIPIGINISEEDAKANRREYVFPFVEEGVTYEVTYSGKLIVNGNEEEVTESLQCVARGGLRYTDYLDFGYIYSLINGDNYLLTVSYDPDAEDEVFSGTFTPRFAKNDIIKNDSIFDDFTFNYHVVLGEVYWLQPTRYWTWARHEGTWNGSSIFDEDGLSSGFKFVGGGKEAVPEDEWAKYNYKYAVYVTPKFTLSDGSGTDFVVKNDLWSEQKNYNPYF